MKQHFFHNVIIAIVVVCVCFWNSCTYDKDEIAPIQEGACDSVMYKFSGDISDIILSNCAIQGCHDATGIGGVTLTTYDEVKAKVDDNRLVVRMVDGSGGYMPPSGKLPDSTLAKVQQWISEGACQ